MTEKRNTVVPNVRPLTEQAFRDTWLLTLARLCRQHGDSTVALWLGVSERHLRNIKAGTALPTADKLWNLLAYDPSAHDELDGEYGLRNVGKNEVCSSDPLTLSLITLARDVAEAEAPDSPGGHSVTDTELRGMDESLLRKVHRVTGTWLERIEEMRRPRVVGGRLMRGHGPLSEPEWAQLDAELAADRRYRRRAWAVLLCGLAAFWAIVFGVLL